MIVAVRKPTIQRRAPAAAFSAFFAATLALPSCGKNSTREVYEGTVTGEYYDPMPNPSPGWRDTKVYLFDLQSADGVIRGFTVLDYGDLALTAEIERFGRAINNGDKVRVKPPAAIVSISLDRIVRAEEIEKVE